LPEQFEKEVKMYEIMVLAVLMQGQGHGYLIAKIINDIIGPYARVSSGRLYPLLAKLEQSSLITTVDEPVSRQQGNRQLHIYKITDAGRLRFRALMEDISSNPGEYRELFRLTSSTCKQRWKICSAAHRSICARTIMTICKWTPIA
jgi:DNA-binding PadR family transcriptional regulator